MPRIRTIKPQFFIDEDVAQLSPLARLLFIGLWTLADREGRLEDRPLRIKVQILPYDDIDADALLGELEDGGFVIRYVVDGRKYIQIRSFEKHQRPNMREPESTIPAPPSIEEPMRAHACTCTHVHDIDEHVHARLEREGERSTCNIYIPPSAGANGDSSVQNADTSPSPKRHKYTQEFEAWWKHYPKKVGKRGAFAAWNTLKRNGELPPVDELIAAVEAQKSGRQWREGYIPDPERWLKKGRWADEVEAAGNGETALDRERKELFGE